MKAGEIKEGDIISTFLHPCYEDKIREISEVGVSHVMLYELLETTEVGSSKELSEEKGKYRELVKELKKRGWNGTGSWNQQNRKQNYKNLSP